MNKINSKRSIHRPLFKILLVFFFSLNQIDSKIYCQENQLKAGIINTVTGGLIGGIGAMINKKKDQKLTKTFLRGFGTGALGGYLVFESKRLATTIYKNDTYAYVYPSKVLNAAGSSIIENAASNKVFYENWHLNIGFTRFDISTKDKLKLKVRILPFSLGHFTRYLISSGNTFNFSESVKLGTLVFDAENIEVDQQKYSGLAIANIIFLDVKKHDDYTKSHELIHVYQYNQFSSINMFLNPVYAKFDSKSKFFDVYHKFFFTDFQVLPISLINIYSDYDKNFLEKDAYTIGSRPGQ